MPVTPTVDSTPKTDDKNKNDDKPYDPADDDFDDADHYKGKEKELEEVLNKKKEKERDREKDRDRYSSRSYRSGDIPTPSSSDLGYGTAPSEFSTSYGSSAGTTPLR